jgi:Tol biopolymer transport system component
MDSRTGGEKMKKSIFYLASILAATLVLAGAYLMTPGAQSADALLGKAIHQEEVEGDFEAAIETYKKLLAEFPDNRPLAARAQFRIGVCFEKLGYEEAEKAFQKVVDNYPDQTEAVKAAREKLSILQRARAIVEKEDQGIKMTEIPIDPNMDSCSFISPDGKKLATVSPDREIWIRDIQSGKEFQLTKTEAREIWCAWSQDSRKIALMDAKRNLYVVSTQGGTPKMLIENDEEFLKEYGGSVPPMTWSSDGQKIYTNYVNKGLVAVPVDGGDIETVDECMCTISPNEEYLAYNGEDQDIYIRSVRGGEPVRLTDHPAKDIAMRWSYDGRWLLFGSDRNGHYQPWIIGISPEGKREGEPFQIPFLTTLAKANLFLLLWAKNGKIGLDHYGGVSNLFVANAEGSEEIQLTKMEWADIGPMWSPDGKHIVYFSSNRKDLGIWIMPGQGSEAKHISSKLQARGGVDNFSDYGWHPNGRSVSCVVDWGDDRGMWTMDIESGLPQKIPFDYSGYISSMDWSPDGKWIAFSYVGGYEKTDIKDSEILCSNIYVMPAEGGKPIRLTKVKEEGLSFNFPRWSPDGQRIAMAGSSGRGYMVGIEGRIYIVDKEGGEPLPITKKVKESVNVRPIRWSQDGEDIYFFRTEGKKNIIYSVSAHGGVPRKINIEEGDSLRGWGSLDISPDGKKIVYHKIMKTIHEFWLLENFLPERKKD